MGTRGHVLITTGSKLLLNLNPLNVTGSKLILAPFMGFESSSRSTVVLKISEGPAGPYVLSIGWFLLL